MVLSGEKLKAAREQAGYSQKELSAAAGLGENAGYRLENNIDDPRFSSIIAVAELLDVSLDFLANRTQDPQAHKRLGDLDPDVQPLVVAMQQNDWAAALDMLLNKVRQNFIEKPAVTGGKPPAKE